MQKLNIEQIETQLALQCAPVITGLKASNLLILPTKDESSIQQIFSSTRIDLFLLAKTEGRVSYFVFDKQKLEALLEGKSIRRLFEKYGYRNFHIGYILMKFRKRYQAYMDGFEEFPHEMGLILGYPIEDVIGFIENDGRNFLYCGYWKVYSDLCKKKLWFQEYDSAKEMLANLLMDGANIEHIIYIYDRNIMKKNQNINKNWLTKTIEPLD